MDIIKFSFIIMGFIGFGLIISALQQYFARKNKTNEEKTPYSSFYDENEKK